MDFGFWFKKYNNSSVIYKSEFGLSFVILAFDLVQIIMLGTDKILSSIRTCGSKYEYIIFDHGSDVGNYIF